MGKSSQNKNTKKAKPEVVKEEKVEKEVKEVKKAPVKKTTTAKKPSTSKKTTTAKKTTEPVKTETKKTTSKKETTTKKTNTAKKTTANTTSKTTKKTTTNNKKTTTKKQPAKKVEAKKEVKEEKKKDVKKDVEPKKETKKEEIKEEVKEVKKTIDKPLLITICIATVLVCAALGVLIAYYIRFENGKLKEPSYTVNTQTAEGERLVLKDNSSFCRYIEFVFKDNIVEKEIVHEQFNEKIKYETKKDNYEKQSAFKVLNHDDWNLSLEIEKTDLGTDKGLNYDQIYQKYVVKIIGAYEVIK